MKKCNQCHQPLKFTDSDHRLLHEITPVIDGKKYGLPEPDLDLQCDLQNRWSFRNHYTFYKRKSSLSGQEIISIYSPDKTDVVYRHDEWWSDAWDATDYGREFDFNRPFFEQFGELFKVVPKIALVQDGTSENCDYTNFGHQNKNCYLMIGVQSEDVYYGTAYFSKDCIDCQGITQCQHCYDSMDSTNCYNGFYLKDCQNCSASRFLDDCMNCQYCVGCKNLKDKKHHIFNRPYSAEQYDQKIKELKLNTHSGAELFKKEFETFKLTLPFRFARQRGCEESTGDFLDGAKDCHYCFDVVRGGENCHYCVAIGLGSHHMMYCNNAEALFSYRSDGIMKGQQIFFSHFMRSCSDCFYCMYCYNCQDCFGCTGLDRKKYCIFNKQYSKEGYYRVVDRIVEWMVEAGEWGRFFPASLSPFGYNETIAFEYFPLTKAEALEKGWKWNDHEPEVKANRVIPAHRLPESIQDVPDDVLNWAIECEATKKPFKIIRKELEFYRHHGLPLPHFHPDERRRQFIKKRAPYRLWPRQCAKCQSEIQTTYSPDRPEVVYCEHCYLKNIY
ncbi:hypothetical protein COY07_04090 [Candidatus Peregrinibacteria bacterium CG_4_10_14_0_2_um_filter_43_11]|nr:MAG: hypothetical protein COY07_04090 [Candidatus Peregrinibacteria bacterium CG_4_10_14_0_2_um_filter_43_11]